MCGIWGLLGRSRLTAAERRACVQRIEARGPEYTAVEDLSGITIGFTRLAINGLTPAGHQPIHAADRTVVCNGELYNYKELATRWGIPLPPGTSDCVILPALAAHLTATELCRTLDGVFAFILVDAVKQEVLVARDPYGVRPLFEGIFPNTDGTYATVWSSELKGLPVGTTQVSPFPPGTWRRYSLITGELLETQKYHTVPHVKLAAFSDRDVAKEALRTSLITAVKKRLLSDRPIGALLSGGVDSSLIAAIAARELAKEGKRLHTFTIGLPGSTDRVYAEAVAAHIGSIHHHLESTPEDFLAAIPQVVRDIESYDITSVRASVGNWLIGKYIKEHTDIKVVFNGDGSDEIGGGYLYFFAAPHDEAFESECERLLNELHIFDVLRSDRSMASHGLEARTPFLDKNVVATWIAIESRHRRPGKGIQMEKQILREAFEPDLYLPHEVLWRKKEAFSDGVSSTQDSWYLRCSEYAKTQEMACRTDFLHNPPRTVEAAWYRCLFEDAYDGWATVIPHMWMPRWIAGASDPSARTLKEIYTA
jgi:asparagine synthase (glutamine-hydrolysing)